MKSETPDTPNIIASETTEKTYKVAMKDQVLKKSVKIRTDVSQEVALDPKDAGKVNQDRMMPEKKIIKTVRIDNDLDDGYDALIKFSYQAHEPSDFMLISDQEELLVAVARGEQLNILENRAISLEDLGDPGEAFIITDENGKKVTFYIQEYKLLNRNSDS